MYKFSEYNNSILHFFRVLVYTFGLGKQVSSNFLTFDMYINVEVFVQVE